MSTIVVVGAIKNKETIVGVHKCVKCGKDFSQKELHLQDVLVIFNPGHLNLEIGSKIYGLPTELSNLFIRSQCPSCQEPNQVGSDLVVLNCNPTSKES